MTKDDQSEITRQFRELTERNLQQARAAYDKYLDTVTQAMSVWTQAPTAMTSGLKEIQDLAIRFAKENAEASFSLGNELANAKDLQELASIQSRYVQDQIQAYGRQAEELGRVMGRATSGGEASEASPERKAPGEPKS
jgi:hypothetical protein